VAVLAALAIALSALPALMLAAPASASDACVPDYVSSFSGIVFRTNCGTVTRQLTSDSSDRQPTLSPDATMVAFVRGGNDFTDVWVVRTAGGPAVQITHMSASIDRAMWSTDSKSLVFGTTTTPANIIYTVNADGSDLQQIDPGMVATDPVWCGGLVVFNHGFFDAAGEWEEHIYKMNPDGSGVTQLTFSSFSEDWPACSPDGRWVFYDDQPDYVHSYVAVVPLAGGTPVRLTGESISLPTVSADWTLGLQPGYQWLGGTVQHATPSIDSFSSGDGSIPAPAGFPIAYKPPDEYQALGDSFSSGEGAPGPSGYLPGSDIPTDRCHRSIKAYSELDKRLMGTTVFGFHACSGAITQDFFTPYPTNHVKNGKPVNPDEKAPQLNWLSARTKVITLTVGGNNVGFPDVMAYCATRALWQATCQSVWGASVDSAIKNISIGTGHDHDNLPDLYAAIRARAPNATVYVLGYPRFFPLNRTARCFTGVPDRFFVASDMRWINGEISKFDTLVNRLATAAGFKYVNVYGALNGHELCTLHPWINSANVLHQVESFHPNVQGQNAMAVILANSR
jgi:hypothetical protein